MDAGGPTAATSRTCTGAQRMSGGQVGARGGRHLPWQTVRQGPGQTHPRAAAQVCICSRARQRRRSRRLCGWIFVRILNGTVIALSPPLESQSECCNQQEPTIATAPSISHRIR